MHKQNVSIITSEQLVSMMERNATLILVDCRSSMEYETSHIKSSINIGGTRTLRRDILQHKISVISLLNNALRECCNRLVTVDDFIIIYDQCSSEPVLLQNQPLLKKILEELLRKFRQVYFLQGGFIGFQSKYTNYCWLNKHKLPDEDFVAPSQSMCHSNKSLINVLSQERFIDDRPSIRATNQSLTRSHTMLALSGRAAAATNEDSPLPQPLSSGGSVDRSDLLTPQQSLSGPALPSTNQGPTTVLKHLLLGSQKDALNQACIQQYKISHVINVSTDGPICPFVTSQNFLRIPVLDNFTDKITNYFGRAFDFLDNVKAVGGRALVHCSAGISRSPTIAIGYLMKTQNIGVTEAYNIVKLSRASVSPNFNFMGQLTDYEDELRHIRDESRTAATSLARPKRRPSRLGFLSTFLRQSIGSVKPNLSPTSDNCSLAAHKISTPLLPSPSVPFAKLGINSPLDELPNLTLKIDNFPSTSLDQLHFQPCQTGGSRGVKVKRSATESTNDSSKVRKRLSMLDSYSKMRSSSPGISVDDSTASPMVAIVSTSSLGIVCSDAHRRHSSVLPCSTLSSLSSVATASADQPSLPTVAMTTTDPSSTVAIDPSLSSIDWHHHHVMTSVRSISYERLNEAANWSGGGNGVGATILADSSCRLQECHQSTSSLSSANSHSSNVLV